ncbi:MAG: ketopantoate reductase family protein [Candidatus Tectimicrobiota bacterium]
MRFVICGAGALGGVLGGQLASAGFEVILIDPQEAHVAAIQAHGLRLLGVLGPHTLHVPAVLRASEVDFQAQDVLILAVKTFDCATALAELRQATALDLPVFCAQNGVGHEALAARYFTQVHGMTALIGAKRLRPGEVVHTGHGPLGIGTYPAGLSALAQAVTTAFDCTALPVYSTPRIGPAKWYKLVLSLNNATMGVTGLGSQEGLAQPEVRHWMAAVWEEGTQVLQAAGLTPEGPPQYWTLAEQIERLRTGPWHDVAPVSALLQGRSSLWQDLYHRRGMVEAADLNGVIVRLGRQHGVPTPYNRVLLELSQAMAAARELPGKYTIDQLRVRVQDAESLWKSSML